MKMYSGIDATFDFWTDTTPGKDLHSCLLVEDIWDSIAQSKLELPMPEWQKLELDKRIKDYKAGKLNLHNWQSVHENIRNKFK